VANDISPTLRSVRELSPHLKSLFIDLRPLIQASKKGLPATSDFLAGLRPVLDALDPFLSNLNPVIRWLNYDRSEITNFLTGPSAALADTLALSTTVPNQPAPLHALRQLSYFSAETLAVHPERLETNRGSGYPQPGAFTNYQAASSGIFPNFDCKPSGGERTKGDGGSPEVGVGFAPCVVAPKFRDVFGGGQAPNLYADP
jgi:phospholipid/cholesterol/gamma-HCH transport system substrate-binding protein